jgi:hypothetical protein
MVVLPRSQRVATPRAPGVAVKTVFQAIQRGARTGRVIGYSGIKGLPAIVLRADEAVVAVPGTVGAAHEKNGRALLGRRPIFVGAGGVEQESMKT